MNIKIATWTVRCLAIGGGVALLWGAGFVEAAAAYAKIQENEKKENAK